MSLDFAIAWEVAEAPVAYPDALARMDARQAAIACDLAMGG